MKKWISFLMVLTMVLSLLTVPAFASAGGTVTVTAEGTAKPNDTTCTVKVYVEGTGIAGIEFQVNKPSTWELISSKVTVENSKFELSDFNESSGIFRATGAPSGSVSGKWQALELIYNMNTSYPEQTSPVNVEASVTVGAAGIYDFDLNNFEVTTPDHFDIKIMSVTLGDVNADESIDPNDALMVLQASVESVSLDDNQRTAADVDKNDSVDPNDALYILQYCVDIIESFDDIGA